MGFSGGVSYGYSYGDGNTLLWILFGAAVVATILAFIFLVPEKRREKMNAFGKFLHDTVNFKYLLVEKILQALYIFATVYTFLLGFSLLFQSYFGRWMGWNGLLIMILGPIVIRLVYELVMMGVLMLKHVIMINKKLKDQNAGSGKRGHDVFASPDLSDMQETVKQHREARQAQAQARAQQPVQPQPRAQQPEQQPRTEAPVQQPRTEAPARPKPQAPVRPQEEKPRFCAECGSRLDENGNCPNCSK